MVSRVSSPKKHHTHPTDASAYDQHFFFTQKWKRQYFFEKKDVLIKRKECVLKSDAIIPAYRYLGQHMNQILKVRLIIGFQDRSYLTIILTLWPVSSVGNPFLLDSSHNCIRRLSPQYMRQSKN